MQQEYTLDRTPVICRTLWTHTLTHSNTILHTTHTHIHTGPSSLGQNLNTDTDSWSAKQIQLQIVFLCYTLNMWVTLVYVDPDKAVISLPLGHCVALQIQLCLVMVRKHPSWPTLPSVAQRGPMWPKALKQWSEWQPVARTTGWNWVPPQSSQSTTGC